MNGYEKALEAYINATNTHKFEQVKTCLAAEAVYFFSDCTCTTLAQIQAYFERAWQVVENEVYGVRKVNWLVSEEQTATCVYEYYYTGLINGETVAGSGRGTNTFVREKSGWKLIHEHLSAGAPM